MLAAHIDRDLVAPIVEAVVAAELAADRVLEGDGAVDERIFGLAAADRLDRRLLDEIGGVEIGFARAEPDRSEEHTSELQSLMRTSYAVFCLKKKKHETAREQRE